MEKSQGGEGPWQIPLDEHHGALAVTTFLWERDIWMGERSRLQSFRHFFLLLLPSLLLRLLSQVFGRSNKAEILMLFNLPTQPVSQSETRRGAFSPARNCRSSRTRPSLDTSWGFLGRRASQPHWTSSLHATYRTEGKKDLSEATRRVMGSDFGKILVSHFSVVLAIAWCLRN
jgi:hypothetical protein